MPVQNAEIAAMFDQAAELLEIKGANPFRVRAYRRAARTVEALPQSLTSLLADKRDLSELPGIGDDLAGKIADIVATGRFALLDELKRELPGELGEIAAVPGLGPKRVKRLYEELKIRTLDDLRRAASAGRIRDLAGFGAKTEQRILAALERKAATEKRFRISDAEAEATALVAWLKEGLKDGEVIVAGSFRRRRATVGDLDILATARNAEAAGDRLTRYDSVAEVVAHGPTRTTVMLRSGLQVDLRAVPKESYGAALLYFTGSKAHNVALRKVAIANGWKLNEYGLFEGKERIAGRTEQEVYKKLGISFIPPELREDRGEIDLARKRKLPKLIELEDLRGDLHVHSNWSDGTVPVAEMARAAKERGYAYLAITDHSRRVTIAHGLDADRLARQIDEIDRLNRELKGIAVLKGIEVDIRADGDLDLPDSILKRLDIVVAAVHSAFNLAEDKQTERIVRALDNRYVSILAHPTGRLIGKREAYAVDMERLLEAAHERGCCMEINGEPERLDLADVHVRMAKDLGVRLAIGTDAHTPAALGYARYALDQARRGWLTAGDVINTRPLGELKKLLKR